MAQPLNGGPVAADYIYEDIEKKNAAPRLEDQQFRPSRVGEAEEIFRFMRKTEKRLFLCQLSAAMDWRQQSSILSTMRSITSVDTAAYLYGPVPSFFSDESPSSLDPGGQDTASKDTDAAPDTATLAKKTTALTVSLPANVNPTQARVDENEDVKVTGPLVHRPHIHATVLVRKAGDAAAVVSQNKKASTAPRHYSDSSCQIHSYASSKPEPVQRPSSVGSNASDASGMSAVYVTQARHVGQTGKSTKKSQPADVKPSFHVSYRIDKLRDPTGDVERKQFRKKMSDSAGLADAEEIDHATRLPEIFSAMTFQDMYSLCQHIFIGGSKHGQERTEMAVHFTDCLRQRLKDRNFWETAPERLVAKVLHYLEPHDACNLVLVCKSWRNILNGINFWRDNCYFLGKEHRFEDLASDIERGNDLGYYIHWKAEYHEWEKILRGKKEVTDQAEKQKILEQRQPRQVDPPKGEQPPPETTAKKKKKKDPDEAKKKALLAKFKTVTLALGSWVAKEAGKILDAKARILKQTPDEEVLNRLTVEELTVLIGKSLVDARALKERAAEEIENRRKALRERMGWFMQNQGTVNYDDIDEVAGWRLSIELDSDEDDITTAKGDNLLSPLAKLPKIPCEAFETRVIRPERLFEGSNPYLLTIASRPSSRTGDTPLWRRQRQSDKAVVNARPKHCRPMRLVRQMETPETQGIICMFADNRRVIGGCHDGKIRIWSVRSGQLVNEYQGHNGFVKTLDAHDEIVVSGGWDRAIQIWNVVRGERVKEIFDHRDTVTSILLRKDLLATGSADNTILVYKRETWEVLAHLLGHTCCVTGIQSATRRGPHHLLSCSVDGKLLLWNLSKLFEVFRARPQTRVDPSADHAASGVHVCRKTGQQAPLYTHPVPLTCLKVEDDLAVLGDTNGDIILFDLAQGSAIHMFSAHKQTSVLCIDLKDEWLVTGGLDRRISQWNLKTGQCIRQLLGHNAPVKAVKCIGDNIMSCSVDRVARIWCADDPFGEIGTPDEDREPPPYNDESRRIRVIKSVVNDYVENKVIGVPSEELKPLQLQERKATLPGVFYS